MKRIILNITTVALLAAMMTACGGGSKSSMTMNLTARGEVTLSAVGSGTATINWGDGSQPDKIALSDKYDKHAHEYSTEMNVTVAITGDSVTGLNCSSMQITALDVSRNTALKILWCHNNQLTALDVSSNIAMETLYCHNNQLTALDVSLNTAMTELDCSGNELTALDVSRNTALERLYCSDNNLTALDISSNIELLILECRNNRLTGIDVDANPHLGVLHCDGNLFSPLADRMSGWIIECLAGRVEQVTYANGDIIKFDRSGNITEKSGFNSAFFGSQTVKFVYETPMRYRIQYKIENDSEERALNIEYNESDTMRIETGDDLLHFDYKFDIRHERPRIVRTRTSYGQGGYETEYVYRGDGFLPAKEISNYGGETTQAVITATYDYLKLDDYGNWLQCRKTVRTVWYREDYETDEELIMTSDETETQELTRSIKYYE